MVSSSIKSCTYLTSVLHNKVKQKLKNTHVHVLYNLKYWFLLH